MFFVDVFFIFGGLPLKNSFRVKNHQILRFIIIIISDAFQAISDAFQAISVAFQAISDAF